MSINNVGAVPQVLDFAALNRQSSPWEAYRALQTESSVAHCADHGGYWALIGYEAVRDAAADPTRFSSASGATIPRLSDPSFPAVPLESDPPDHRQYRKVLQDALRPSKVAEFEPLLRSMVTDCVDAFCGRGTAELHEELAMVVPPALLANILGLPADEATDFALWTNNMVRAAAAGDLEAKRKALGQLMEYIKRKVAESQSSPGEGLLSDVANAQVKGARISFEAACGAVFLLIVAGHETTINGIASALSLIGSNPEVRDLLIEDPSLIPAAVEESLRLQSPVQFMGRTTTEAVDVAGWTIGPSQSVALMWGLANHDAAYFENPDRFDLDRGQNRHLAFGHGVHRCVGEHLARLELSVCIEEILGRLPDFQTRGPLEVHRNGGLNRGPAVVHIEFTPREAGSR
jgi:cytochrome P450